MSLDDFGSQIQSFIVRLIEEDLWFNEDAIACTEDESMDYLRKEVFPTLIPALHALLSKVQKTNGDAFNQCAGDASPCTWIAHYLLRNNISQTSKLVGHPYNVINTRRINEKRPLFTVRKP
ncbi:unnamed protein product [Phytomonas sp. EM1]|nr:unnamed protein product [Phytomonas sp. EM1]|eukprot:CCW62862.1 unnamed protein product [Phytomonas sp. isolate EM1]